MQKDKLSIDRSNVAKQTDVDKWPNPLSVDDLKDAESSILKYVQMQAFHGKLKTLKVGENDATMSQVKKSSPLYKLSSV